MDVINVLKIQTGQKQFKYYDFMGLIRYDKNLRDNIYKYLSVLEELVKETIFLSFEYRGKNKFSKITKKNIEKFTKLEDKENYGWNFYRNPILDFGSILFFIKKKKFNIEYWNNDYDEDLKNVKHLRNIVMHHKMLIIEQEANIFTKESIEKRIQTIKEYIISLYKLLPREHGKGLITSINKSNIDKNKGVKSKYIFIEKLEGGYN